MFLKINVIVHKGSRCFIAEYGGDVVISKLPKINNKVIDQCCKHRFFLERFKSVTATPTSVEPGFNFIN